MFRILVSLRRFRLFGLCLMGCLLFPLPELSSASSYCIKPGRGIFFLFWWRKGAYHTPASFFLISAWSLIQNVLGSRLSLSVTNSSRKGSNLWGTGGSTGPPGRRAQCWTRHGGDSAQIGSASCRERGGLSVG